MQRAIRYIDGADRCQAACTRRRSSDWCNRTTAWSYAKPIPHLNSLSRPRVLLSRWSRARKLFPPPVSSEQEQSATTWSGIWKRTSSGFASFLTRQKLISPLQFPHISRVEAVRCKTGTGPAGLRARQTTPHRQRRGAHGRLLAL